MASAEICINRLRPTPADGLWRAERFLTWTRIWVVLAVLTATGVRAQDLEPRLYANTPVGVNFLIAGYSYSQGNMLADPSVPLTNGEVTIHSPVLAYARSLNLWGLSGKVDAVLPYACASGSAEFAGMPGQRDVCGLADPRARLSVNFYGAPALRLEEFAQYQQDILVGASVQVAAASARAARARSPSTARKSPPDGSIAASVACSRRTKAPTWARMRVPPSPRLTRYRSRSPARSPR